MDLGRELAAALQPHVAAQARRRVLRAKLRWALVTLTGIGVVVWGGGGLLGVAPRDLATAYVVLGALLIPTAGMMAGEVARYRRCGRCGWSLDAEARSCAACGNAVVPQLAAEGARLPRPLRTVRSPRLRVLRQLAERAKSVTTRGR